MRQSITDTDRLNFIEYTSCDIMPPNSVIPTWQVHALNASAMGEGATLREAIDTAIHELEVNAI